MFNLSDIKEVESRTPERVVGAEAANDDKQARYKSAAPLVSIGLIEPLPQHTMSTNQSNGCDFFGRAPAGLHIPSGGRF